MKILNRETRKAERMIDLYRKAKCHSVYDFYKKPSKSIVDRYKKTYREMTESFGLGYYITAGNCITFSCGYTVWENPTLYLIYHTPFKTYKIEL